MKFVPEYMVTAHHKFTFSPFRKFMEKVCQTDMTKRFSRCHSQTGHQTVRRPAALVDRVGFGQPNSTPHPGTCSVGAKLPQDFIRQEGGPTETLSEVPGAYGCSCGNSSACLLHMRPLQIKSNHFYQITFIVTSPQHVCLGE